jgi:hypothetical protein
MINIDKFKGNTYTKCDICGRNSRNMYEMTVQYKRHSLFAPKNKNGRYFLYEKTSNLCQRCLNELKSEIDFQFEK